MKNEPQTIHEEDVELLPTARPPRRARRTTLHRDEAEPTLRHVVRTLSAGRWLVAGVAAVVVAATAAYLWTATPIYEAGVLIQVEERRPTIAGLEELSAILRERSPADTEIALLRSHYVLGSVADQLGLDVEVQPVLGLGERLLRKLRLELVDGRPRLRAKAVAPPVRVAKLAVPPDLEDRPLLLTSMGGGRFGLETLEGEPLLSGAAGAPAVAEQGGRRVELALASLDAPAGARFTVVKRVRADVVAWLRASLRVGEEGKNTGIITVRTEGPDPRRIVEILNAVAATYLRQNVERKSAEAENTLGFLESQLPQLKAQVDRAEAALRAFQTRKGTVVLSREAESTLERSVAVERELSELELQRAELRQRFTDRHPQLVAVAEKIEQLRARRGAVDGRLRDLPSTELESARLTRDVRVASQLYDVLLNRAQELRIVRSGIVGNVRIVDPAVLPRKPARPLPRQVLALGVLLGLGLGVVAAMARAALDEGASDPAEIESRVGLPVYVTIPHSSGQEDVTAQRARGRAIPALAVAAPDDMAIESLRSLRTALQFALVEARSNVIVISSPAPGVGKSFIALNLSLLLAAAGKRVLLVDADLRRGRLHRAFSLPRSPGLSDLVSGGATVDAALRPTGVEHLHLLSTGRVPPNPAELLASARFHQLVATMSPRYDLVIVDTPPVLAVTDATLVARCAGVNLLVLRSGRHPLREIALAVKQFTQNGLHVQGAILNDAKLTRGGMAGSYRYYEYRSQPD